MVSTGISVWFVVSNNRSRDLVIPTTSHMTWQFLQDPFLFKCTNNRNEFRHSVNKVCWKICSHTKQEVQSYLNGADLIELARCIKRDRLNHRGDVHRFTNSFPLNAEKVRRFEHSFTVGSVRGETLRSLPEVSM